MEVTVRLFAAYREAAGWSEQGWEVAEESTAAELWSEVREELGDLRPTTPLCAVNERHAAMDRALAANDVVAFFPPVSGGAPEGGGEDAPRWRGRRLVVAEPLDRRALEAAVQADDCGALCTFVGVVRDHHEGRQVEAVSYEAYAEMAGAELARLCEEAERLWPGTRALMVHRTGRLAVGEASVFVAAASPHRAEAFEACRYLIEELKKSAPVWKKDHFADGEDTWRDR